MTTPGEVELQFLGSGDAFGSGGRFQACLMLSGAGANVLLDCGATSLTAMKRFGVDPSSIETVVVSHLHGDHFGGLPFLILDGQFSRRATPLVIAGPTSIEERTKAAMEVLFPGSSNVSRRFDLEWVELQEETATEVGPSVVTAYKVKHASGATSFGLRVEYGDRVIAYSGDTEWTDVLISVARGSDVFVCESYLFDKQVKFHLDFETLRRNLDRLECKRVIVTHMGQSMLDRLDDIDIEAAHDGLTLQV